MKMQPIAKPILSVAPTNLAVPLETLKSYLRVDHASEDTLIELILKSAIEKVEKLIAKKLINQTWIIYFDQWPHTKRDDWWDGVREGSISNLYGPCGYLELPFGQIQTLTSIKTYDGADTEYLFDASNYTVEISGVKTKVALKDGSVWPATVLRNTNGIKVEAVFGYGSDDSFVPNDIKMAILTLAARMYEHRGDELPEIPGTVLTLLSAYEVIRVG